MEKSLFEQTGGSYEMQGDYLIPCLTLPPKAERPIDIWGQRHRRYLKAHHRILYSNLLTSGKLNGYLADIDGRATEMFSRQVKELAEKEGITETLKAKDQLLWVQRMNAVREIATEIVNNDLIDA